jgi:hypothetical protein
MQFIEKFISPVIQEQFPNFYKEEGELFVTFVKAYYEWLESSAQELVLENPENFNVNDFIQQAETTGTIISKNGNRIIVEANNFDTFRCNINCDNLDVLVSSSGGSTFISSQQRMGAVYWARHLPDVRDIDKTLERFILQFKNKYLPNIQFTTATNKELFIKNSLDFYRAKGTPRAVDLFFKLVHGIEADVFYPSDDIFRLSDNIWANVNYIEVEPSDINVNFVGQTVYGATSGASAFVERFVRVKKGTLFIPVLFIANLRGSFQTGEQIFTIDLEKNITNQMIGSLSELKITFSSPNFEVGENVIVTDGRGKNAKARVTSVTTLIGAVDFELLDGGWGYIPPSETYIGSEIIGSNRVLRLNNYSISNSEFYYQVEPFKQFETIKQDLISVTGTNTQIQHTFGETVFGYSDTNELIFEGFVVNVDESTGEHVVFYDGREFDTAEVLTIDALTNENNTTIIEVNSIDDVTATANVIATSNTITYEYALANNAPLTPALRLKRNDRLNQFAKINKINLPVANSIVLAESANLQLGTFEIEILRNNNVFRDSGEESSENPNPIFIRESDNAAYKIINARNIDIGVITPTNTFYVGAGIYGTQSGAAASISGNFFRETPASFSIESVDEVTLAQVPVSYVFLSSIADKGLDEEDYEIQYTDPVDPEIIIPIFEAGANTPLSELGAFTYRSFGSIQQIVVINPGRGYPSDPFFIVHEPNTVAFSRYDFVFGYAESNRSFAEGETLFEIDEFGEPTGFKARIETHDRINQIIFATRIYVAEDEETVFNRKCFKVGNSIRSDSTNVSATLTYVNERRKNAPVGLNAKIRSTAFTGSGVATSLQVINSGFGYDNFDPNTPARASVLRLVSELDSNKRVEAQGFLGTSGIAEGFHLNRRSFLSSDKYLQDNDFYQEYSYQVLTALPFNVYRKTLIDVLHVAGTKPFGLYVATSENELEIQSESILPEKVQEEE